MLFIVVNSKASNFYALMLTSELQATKNPLERAGRDAKIGVSRLR
jgi:hypothetical protein